MLGRRSVALRTLHLRWVLGLVGVALVAAGCGSSGNNTSSGAPAGSSGGSSTGTLSSKQTSALQALLAPLAKLPPTIAVSTPLKKKPTGQLVEFLECSASACKVISGDLQTGAALLGLRYKAIQAGATPESFQAAAQQAVNDHPAAVVMVALDASLISKQLAEMKAANIYTVDSATASPASNFDTFLLSQQVLGKVGQGLAAYAILHSGGKAHMLYINWPVFTYSVAQTKKLQETTRSECPRCTLDTMNILPTDVGTDLPGKIIAALQQNPSINWIVFSNGGMDLGVEAALRSAGLADKVKMIADDTSAANYQDLKDHVLQVDISSDKELLSFYELDAIARHLDGQPVSNLANLQLFTTITAQDITFNPQTGSYHPIPTFKQQFEKLWSGSKP